MAVIVRHHAAQAAQLELIDWWVCDAYFDVDDLSLTDRDLSIPFQSPPFDDEGFPQPTLIRRGWFFRYYRQPYVRCTITVRHVQGIDPPPADLENPGWFSCIEVAPDERALTFRSITESEFTVRVSRLDVELEATDEVAYYLEHGEGRWLEAQSVGPPVDGPG